MNYEIDFLAVGAESKGGDAICFRYWNDYTPQFVGIIDGGTKATGAALVEHIKTYYGTETVDVVINTHPHADHTTGLTEVLEHLEVNLLMMHQPWDHSDEILHLFYDGRITSNSLAERVKRGLQQTHDLLELSLKKEIPIAEPFAGGQSPSPYITFLGPSRAYYQELLPDFTSTPKAASLTESVVGIFQKSVNWIQETWDRDELVDPVDGTNAENNSSVITLLTLGERRFLFTADAGVPALDKACDFAETNGIPLQAFHIVQIPHHGSKRNVGPTILNRLVGPIAEEGVRRTRAFVSVPVNGEPKHPSRRVTNAFNRRGATVIATKGFAKSHSDGAPDRSGWSDAVPVPFYTEVEE